MVRACLGSHRIRELLTFRVGLIKGETSCALATDTILSRVPKKKYDDRPMIPLAMHYRTPLEEKPILIAIDFTDNV